MFDPMVPLAITWMLTAMFVRVWARRALMKRIDIAEVAEAYREMAVADPAQWKHAHTDLQSRIRHSRFTRFARYVTFLALGCAFPFALYTATQQPWIALTDLALYVYGTITTIFIAYTGMFIAELVGMRHVNRALKPLAERKHAKQFAPPVQRTLIPQDSTDVQRILASVGIRKKKAE